MGSNLDSYPLPRSLQETLERKTQTALEHVDQITQESIDRMDEEYKEITESFLTEKLGGGWRAVAEDRFHWYYQRNLSPHHLESLYTMYFANDNGGVEV